MADSQRDVEIPNLVLLINGELDNFDKPIAEKEERMSSVLRGEPKSTTDALSPPRQAYSTELGKSLAQIMYRIETMRDHLQANNNHIEL